MIENEDKKLIEVVSVKFKNRGKTYFFSPEGMEIKSGSKLVVETSKGLELADCCYGNHQVMDEAVVQPLKPVVRVATAEDLRTDAQNRAREKEAFDICEKKISEHGLDMKLVDTECSFDGSKTTFFFTSDGRVDFRELVKDLAGVFRNRIELRQIGVRDEAKMVGGIGICGRPYCCSQFLDDFQPVSTKMAKVQSLSLNPTKISGSCGRLMCCLRYEQEAYEDLLKKVPKAGAFVETKDGYGTAVQVNLLRQTVKVKLDDDADDSLKLFKANELAAVPGGRPKEGEPYPSVLNYVPVQEEEEKEDEWAAPVYAGPQAEEEPEKPDEEKKPESTGGKRHRRGNRSGKKQGDGQPGTDTETGAKKEKTETASPEKKTGTQKVTVKSTGKSTAAGENDKNEDGAQKPVSAQPKKHHRRSGAGKTKVKPVKVEVKTEAVKENQPSSSKKSGQNVKTGTEKEKPAEKSTEQTGKQENGSGKKSGGGKKHYYHKHKKASVSGQGGAKN